jgi:beta-hydroxylase
MIPKGSFLYAVIASPGLLLIRSVEFWIRRLQGDHIFFDSGEFSWTAKLEDNWTLIRRELSDVLPGPIPNFQEVSEEQARITQGDAWKTYFFYAYGHKFEPNCARCPETTRLLEEIPGMSTAMFSILNGRGHISPHRGPYKGVLRCHLALLTPADRSTCRIRVGSETRRWEEGKTLIFDDTHDHEAWNDSSEPRVVLFVDFLRDLPPPLSWVNRGMVWLIGASPFIQNLLEKLGDYVRSDVGAVPARRS